MRLGGVENAQTYNPNMEDVFLNSWAYTRCGEKLHCFDITGHCFSFIVSVKDVVLAQRRKRKGEEEGFIEQ